MERLKINLIGPGKVGLTILRRIAMTGAHIVQDIAGRSIEKAEAAVAFVGAGAAVRSVADMRQADLWLLTVPDSQVATAAAELAATPTASGTPSVAVHCSGFLPADEMKPLRALGWQLASLHPVLTFAEPAKAVSHFDGVSCGMEGDAGALALVKPLVTEIGGRPFGIRSEAKAIYHAAAVFSSNFNVVLQAIAREAWAQAGVPDDVAAALNATLMSACTDNVMELGPARALTGPASRGDQRVVDEQEAAVRSWHPDAGEIYREMSVLAQRLKRTGGTLE